MLPGSLSNVKITGTDSDGNYKSRGSEIYTPTFALRCLPPHAPMATTPCSAVYHPTLRCLPPHPPLSTTPCPAAYCCRGAQRCAHAKPTPEKPTISQARWC